MLSKILKSFIMKLKWNDFFLKMCPEAEFKEYDWFHLKLYSMFQDLSRRSIKTGFWRIWDAAQIH